MILFDKEYKKSSKPTKTMLFHCQGMEERLLKGLEFMNLDNRLNPEAESEEIDRPSVSGAVIRRLPRYFRYLRELIRQGKMRISSGEFSEMMGLTASQIRQDLNCFGGFGQQGYGYNVNYLYAKISELLGVGAGLQAIIIGAGDLGRAIVRSSMFEKRGVDVIALFDVDPALIGREIGDVPVYDMKDLESFCERHSVDMAVLTLPKECVESESARLLSIGVRGFWNFTGKELSYTPDQAVIENVHLGDSLMSLNYEICRMKSADGRRK